MIMPKHRDVTSLKNLSLRGIGSLVGYVGRCHVSKIQACDDSEKIISSLQQSLNWLNKHLVSHVPCYLYDAMAVEVLKSVEALIEETKMINYPHTSTEMNIVVSLTEVVLSSHLRQIDFSKWSDIIRYILYTNLQNMTGLENLRIISYSKRRITECDNKYLLDRISAMKHLKSLWHEIYSSDEIVRLVAENCPNIQNLDLTSSRLVTDRSIPFLLKCKNLQKLELYETSISIEGLAQLIMHLPKLQDIGLCCKFGNIINCLHKNHSYGPFCLKKIDTEYLSIENLKMLVKMFPKVEYIKLVNGGIPDLTVLSSLDNLKTLNVRALDTDDGNIYGNIKGLLEVKGNNITNLFLESATQMDFKVLIDIGQYCPELKSLVFYECDFINSISFPTRRIKSQLFLNLERIFWGVDGDISYLEFMLSHAPNIRYLQFNIDITYSTIVKVLNVNPMKELTEFMTPPFINLDMRIVKLLISSCPNIKMISAWMWKGTTIDELISFQRYICSKNWDLDIKCTRPSFSTYMEIWWYKFMWYISQV